MILKTNPTFCFIFLTHFFLTKGFHSLNLLQDLSDLHYLSDSIFFNTQNTFSEPANQKNSFLINNQTRDFKNWDHRQIQNAKHELSKQRHSEIRHKIRNQNCYAEFIDLRIEETLFEPTQPKNVPFNSSFETSPIPSYPVQTKNNSNNFMWPKENRFQQNKYGNNFGGFFGRMLQTSTSFPTRLKTKSNRFTCIIWQHFWLSSSNLKVRM